MASHFCAVSQGEEQHKNLFEDILFSFKMVPLFADKGLFSSLLEAIMLRAVCTHLNLWPNIKVCTYVHIINGSRKSGMGRTRFCMYTFG